jgi:hypothetical protein
MFVEGQALQLTSGLDFLSIQAYRLWMEHPSSGKVRRYLRVAWMPHHSLNPEYERNRSPSRVAFE